MRVRIKLLLKNQNGQVVILTALMLPILCVLLGLGVDLGMLVLEKANMQNAVDLSVLSAVQNVKDSHGAVESTAIDIARKNGVNANELKIVHPYNDDNYKVEIKAKRKIKFFFMPLVGVDSTIINVRAVAQMNVTQEIGTISKALDYAVFHGSSVSDLQIKGNNSAITGNVHSNKKVAVMGPHTINGDLTAIEGSSGDLSRVSGTINTKATPVPMPDLIFNDYVSKADKVFNSNQIFNKMDISGIWYVNGDVTINSGRVTGKGILLASGNIKVATSGIEYSTSNDLLALYSQGNIQISSSGSQVQGVLYAPNGQIQINGSGNTFYGALIANEIWWATKDITINGNYDIRTPQAFNITKEEILLIE